MDPDPPAELPEPPEDAEDWTDEQWIEWLERTDSAEGGQPTPYDGPPRRSTGKQLLAAAMLGLHQAIYGPKKDEIAIVVDAGGDPPDPDEMELHLEDEPAASKVIIHRPYRGRAV